VEKNFVTQTGLGYGCWYWRITPVFPPRTSGEIIPSTTGEFSVIGGGSALAPPVLTFPPQGGKMSSGGCLAWDFDPNAAFWIVELSDKPDMADPVVKQKVSSNYFSLPSNLPQTTWYWRVSALASDEGGGAVSAVWNFELSSGKPPAARPVLPVHLPAHLPAKKPAEKPKLPPLIFRSNADNWDDLDAETAAENERTLSRAASFLSANSEYRLLVEGHANPTVNPANRAARRREEAEELLPMSVIRARAVAERLVKLDVDPNRIGFYGLGGERPVAAWEDVKNWRKNRRVEFILER
jgi:outer membrane protein OmpA-like peptidoglycan-associated protein